MYPQRPPPKQKTTRADPFQREPLAPFRSLEREKYAVARAKGQTVKQASEAAGVSTQSGQNYEKHPSIRARIGELRENAETFVGVSTSWIISQLMVNVKESRDLEQFKASNDALMLIYKIMGENRDLAGEMARSLPPDVSPSKLRGLLSQKFAQREKLPKPSYTPPPAVIEHEAEHEADDEPREQP